MERLRKRKQISENPNVVHGGLKHNVTPKVSRNPFTDITNSKLS